MQDKKEFIEIIQRNEGIIYKVAKVYTDCNDDEQDLYQEIVYQLWKSFHAFRKESKISTWIYRIALNTSLTHFKKEKKKGDHVPINEAVLNQSETNDNLKEERIEILYDQLRKLNAIDKGIIFLYLEGKNYEEIANITGFTATNIGTRLGRIKRKIISQLN